MSDSEHVFLMSKDSAGTRDEYWFGSSTTVATVSGLLSSRGLPPSETKVEGFLADPNAPQTDIAQVSGIVYYLARHRHHR